MGEGKGPNLLKVGLGLAAAEVGHGPGGVAQHRDLRVLLELLHEGREGAVVEDEVAAGGGVASDVAEGPDSLRRESGQGVSGKGAGSEASELMGALEGWSPFQLIGKSCS